ncbi:MAG: hypothetical protein GF313_07095 [Caldithrix sp.]|nr:hypothetical protein [Caldithrix sp.]
MNKRPKNIKPRFADDNPNRLKTGDMIKIKTILATILFAVSSLWAQELTIESYVDRNPVAVNQRFNFSIEIAGQSAGLPEVDFPDLNPFNILAGPNQSTSIKVVNGAMTSSKTYSFILMARKAGEYKIGQATVKHEGKTYSTSPIKLVVTKSGQTNPPPKNNNSQKRNDVEIAGQSLYIKTDISKTDVYLGQEIDLEYKVYFRVNIRDNAIDALPSYTGFWNETFETPSRSRIRNEVINGVNYNVATIRKVALFPTKTGKITIEPMTMTFEVLVRSNRRRSLFDNFFDDPFGRTVQKSVSSQPITVNVKPLPQKGKPASFSGAVGDFDLNVSVDKQRTQVNEAIALNVTINGQGNIKLLDLPQVIVDQDIEMYDPKISSTINNKGGRIRGSKSAEYILIPRLEGNFEIKPIRFSYFDPLKETYKALSHPVIPLNILPGKQQATNMSSETAIGSRREVSLLGKDIRFIKQHSEFMPKGYQPYTTTTYQLNFVAAFLLFIAFFLYNDHQAKLQSDIRLARSRRAGKIAAKHLAEAKRMISRQESTEFYKAVSRALQGFLRDKLNIGLTDFSARNIREKLNEQNVDDPLIKDYLDLLNECDYNQYARASASADERKAFYERAKSLLTRFEKWI